MRKSLIVGLVCLAIIFPSHSQLVPALASGCSVSGGQSGHVKYSGQLSTISAKVCGDAIWKLLGKPKKPVKKKKPSKPVHYNHQIVVIPDQPLTAPVGTIELQIGQPLNLLGISKKHIRNRRLLWFPAQISFTPAAFSWTFGDGKSLAGRSGLHSWQSAGTYSVQLNVKFNVKYRIVGASSWVKLPGQVVASAIPLKVQISNRASPARKRISLVHWNCLELIQGPGC